MTTDGATPKKRRSSRELIASQEPITVRDLYAALSRIVADHGDLPVWVGMDALGRARRVEVNRRGAEEWRGVFICER